MAKAVSAGMPKLRIEDCAARRQARIDSNKGTHINPLCRELNNNCTDIYIQYIFNNSFRILKIESVFWILKIW